MKMWETDHQFTIICHQIKFQVPGLGYIGLNCFSKGSHGNPEKTQAVVKAVGCSPQNDSKTFMLKATSTQLTEHLEVD